MSALTIRPPEPADWAAIAELANVAVAAVEGAPMQSEWVANRRSFVGLRRHHVAVRGGSVVGYCGIEQQSTDASLSFRVFLVVDWAGPRDLPVCLYAQVESDLADLQASEAWLREYADDRALTDFFIERGYVAESYRAGETEVVRLSRALDLCPR